MAPSAAEDDIERRLTLLRERLKQRASKTEFVANKRARTSPPEEFEGETVQDRCFMELFAGEAGLTQAVRRQNTRRDPGWGRIAVGTVLLCNAIKLRKVRWLHAAPPSKTFSRARRRDKYAKARQLRSVQCPDGIEPKTWRVKEANVLASRAAQLSRLQCGRLVLA